MQPATAGFQSYRFRKKEKHMRNPGPVDPEHPAVLSTPRFLCGHYRSRKEISSARLRRKTTSADGRSGRAIQLPRSTGQAATSL